jgi:ketosteroid isomerase-like protein
MKKLITLFLLIPFILTSAQTADTEAIKKEILSNSAKMAEYWNKGELDNYMNICYPKSDKLLMQSANARIYGYQKIYDMYAKIFPNADARGVLSFSDLEVTVITPDAAMQIGKFTLEFKDGKKRSGYFTALLNKFADGWKIIHDHS